MCIRATKAWFFLDEGMVALGAGIKRSADCTMFPATTALQQSNLAGLVFVGELASGKTPRALAPNSTTVLAMDPTSNSSGLSGAYAWHDGMAYIALQHYAGAPTDMTERALSHGPSALVVSNAVRNGTEYEVTQGDNKTIALPVFSALVTHPASVDAHWVGRYAYFVMPVDSAQAVPSMLKEFWMGTTVVANTDALQAVCRRGNGSTPTILQATVASNSSGRVAAARAGCWDVLIPSAQPSCRDGIACSGAIVQVRQGADGRVSVSVAVPTRRYQDQRTMTIVLLGPKLSGTACTVVADGTAVTVPMNQSQLQPGATNTVICVQATGTAITKTDALAITKPLHN
jgi:hypothetical protein